MPVSLEKSVLTTDCTSHREMLQLSEKALVRCRIRCISAGVTVCVHEIAVGERNSHASTDVAAARTDSLLACLDSWMTRVAGKCGMVATRRRASASTSLSAFSTNASTGEARSSSIGKCCSLLFTPRPSTGIAPLLRWITPNIALRSARSASIAWRTPQIHAAARRSEQAASSSLPCNARAAGTISATVLLDKRQRNTCWALKEAGRAHKAAVPSSCSARHRACLAYAAASG
mmetsp:Transcript_45817/g.106934  ORF Transcript_45817/g.106934 Transcript_45817/m.106934 type:complete len:232 (+) Transcript_45817:331-1026(+)